MNNLEVDRRDAHVRLVLFAFRPVAWRGCPKTTSLDNGPLLLAFLSGRSDNDNANDELTQAWIQLLSRVENAALPRLRQYVKQVTVWYPRDGVRSRGRKVQRWENELKVILGPLSLRVAADRRQRKKLEEAYVQGTPNAETYCK
ncbi:hypothetical protein EVAR_98358_1 [Eumeta japonica]|uniref:Uncharacterized protein n=1 Tax=Eumeta variegata TaxID=151549 RepID=A0A4C2AH44_EUMVA|nr:hypothetical protein EVAR_98358_1 [Eumeta japonica]